MKKFIYTLGVAGFIMTEPVITDHSEARPARKETHAKH